VLEKQKQLQLHGYCEFGEGDWRDLRVDIKAIRDLIFLGGCDEQVGLYLRRAVVVGCVDHGEVRFFSKQGCPTRRDAVLADYASALGNSDALLRLVSTLLRLGPRETMGKPSLRILVELLCRHAEFTKNLPPHQDGVGCLFFLCLHNSMLGGEMNIYRWPGEIEDATVSFAERGTLFYDERGMELLRRIPADAGNGYFIDEQGARTRSSLMHGCNAWTYGRGKPSARVCARISFAYR
jgi:hypothetical protein